MDKWTVTVNDVMNREMFQKARLIAGKGGLQRDVKWTHILETKDFDLFLNGGELILTTGSALKFDSKEELSYIKKLIQKKTAGLCIELGTHIKRIAPEIIHFANQKDYPIIVFDEVVKFVEITQDLHTLIVNHHHQLLDKLFSFSKRFNELSLLPNGTLKILKEIHTQLHTPVFLITDEDRYYYYPPNIKQNMKSFITKRNKAENNKMYQRMNDTYYTFYPVRGLGHEWGYLTIENPYNTRKLDEFTFSMIDRAASALAQIMIRNQAKEERKQIQEDEIVQDVLSGKENDASAILSVLPEPSENLYYRLVLIQYDQQEALDEWKEQRLQQSMVIRSLFRKHGFFPAISLKKNEIAVIATYYRDDNENDSTTFMEITNALQKIEDTPFRIGISNVKNHYDQLRKSYKEAKDVLTIKKRKNCRTLFYEELGVYRVLLEQNSQNVMEEFIDDYIGPLLKYDEETNGNLLLTLSTYLRCMGSKKETAEALYIVRQTLYHRLDKIKELLGEDYMHARKRQAIELAIAAHLMNTGKFDDGVHGDRFSVL